MKRRITSARCPNGAACMIAKAGTLQARNTAVDTEAETVPARAPRPPQHARRGRPSTSLAAHVPPLGRARDERCVVACRGPPPCARVPRGTEGRGGGAPRLSLCGGGAGHRRQRGGAMQLRRHRVAVARPAACAACAQRRSSGMPTPARARVCCPGGIHGHRRRPRGAATAIGACSLLVACS